MPVHERIYRRIEGGRPRSVLPSFLAVADYALLGHKRSWVYRTTLIACFVPPLVVSFVVYLTTRTLPGAGAAAVDPDAARAAYEGPALSVFAVQLFFLSFFTAMAGGPTISEDLRRHALELYFSKPLRAVEYAFGKWFALFRALSGAIVPPLALSGAAVIGLAPGGFEAFGGLVVRTMLAGAVAAAVCATVVLGVSSFGRSGRYAVVLWFVVSLFTHLASRVLVGAVHDERFAVVSFRDDLRYVGAAIMNVSTDAAPSFGESPGVGACAAALCGWCLLAALAVAARVRKASSS